MEDYRLNFGVVSMRNALRRKTLTEKLEEELNFLINQKTIFDVSKEKYETNI
ncbi:MAG: hypothetical protein QXJ62_07165 [Nitrososphaeria archaeon]